MKNFQKFLVVLFLSVSLFSACEYKNTDEQDPVFELTVAKRIQNVSNCESGCTVVIGDSNTFWYNWNFIPGNVCNLGIGGTEISFVINNIDKIVSMNPERLIIWTGQNNQKQPIEQIRLEYDKLFVELKKVSCPIYFLSMHPYYCGQDNTNMILMSDYLKSHTYEGYTYIDIYDQIEECGRKCFFNTGHLSETGFEIIKTNVLNSI